MDWQALIPAVAYMAAGGTVLTILFAVFIVFERRTLRGALIFSAIVLAGFYLSLGLFLVLDRPALSMTPMMLGVYAAAWYGRRYWAGRGPR